MDLSSAVVCCIVVACIPFMVYADPCNNHIELINEVKRSSTYQFDLSLDTPINDLFLTDGWYKIISPHGDEMPTSAPGPLRCGTWYPIWLNDTLPTSADGIVSKEVCMQSFTEHCSRSWNIDIKNCNDEFFVYNLIQSQVEKSAYCFGSEPVPCPDGQSSETGFYPDCGSNFPDKTISPIVEADLVKGPEIFPPLGHSLETAFRCKFDEIIGDSGETYLYDVIWYINGHLVKEHKEKAYTDIESSNLVEDNWVGTHKLNMVVNCSVRMRFNAGSTPSPHQNSPVYSAGIFPDSYEFQVKEDETITIKLHSTFPVGCIGHTEDDRKGCTYKLRLVQPKYQKDPLKCNNNINDNDLVFERQNCNYEVVSATWNDPIFINITGYVNGQYDYSDRTTYLRVTGQASVDPSPWDGIEIPEIKILVTDEENVLSGRVCESFNDPHMYTADRRPYEFHSAGEFILYRHKTQPYQVNALYGWCNNDWATCNCGIAIRSGKSLFVMRNCDEITKYNTHTHNPLIEMRSCDDSSMTIQENGDTYTVTLPIGTEITFSTSSGWGVWNKFIGYIHIKPSIIDVGNAEGLCGEVTAVSADQSDDFTLRDGTVTHDPDIFGENWRVATEEEKFFVNYPKVLSENINLQQYCICDDITDPGTADKEFNFQCGLQGPMQSCLKKTANAANFHTTCSTGSRKRRSLHHLGTRSLTDNDDVIDNREMFIASDDELKRNGSKANVTEWPAGWTEETARVTCESEIESSIRDETLEASHLETEGYILACMSDIQFVGDTRFLQDAIGSMQDVAISEISRNESLFIVANENANQTSITTKSVGDMLLSSLCRNNCSNNGVCQNGVCFCNYGFGKQDCSEDLSLPPRNTSIPFGGRCNTRERLCAKTNVQGIFYSRNITCSSRHFQVKDDGSWDYTSAAQKYPAEYKNAYLVACELKKMGRKKRSTADTIIADGYEISLSNDGSSFGDSMKILIYDEECFSCDISNVTCISMDSCPVETTTLTLDDTTVLERTTSTAIPTSSSSTTNSLGSTSTMISLSTSTSMSTSTTSKSKETASISRTTASSTTTPLNEDESQSSTNQATVIGIVVGVISVLIIAVAGLIFYKIKTANKNHGVDNMIQNFTYGNVPPKTTSGPSKFSNTYFREKTNTSLGNLSLDVEEDQSSRPRTPVELFFVGNSQQ